MNILHIANVRDRPQSGVAVVVPKHVKYQSEYANTALLNIDEFKAEGSGEYYPIYFYKKGMLVSELPNGFSNPDLVVFHEVYWPPFLSLAKELRSRGIPYIIIPHVSLTDTAQKSKRLKKILGNILYFNSFVRGSVAIQYLSVSEKEQTSKFSNIKSITRSNAIDFRGKLKSEFSANGLRLIYVGRLAYHVKGIDRILEAAKLLKEKGITNIQFSLFGSDHDGGKVKIDEVIKAYDLEATVTVGSGLFGDEKISEILKNDCFIQLSRTEGQPLGVMEAMEIGMPCVVTRGTTFFDIVKDNKAGIAVSDDPTDTVKELLRISKNKSQLNTISSNATDYIHSNYNWGVVAQETIEDYSILLEELSK